MCSGPWTLAAIQSHASAPPNLVETPSIHSLARGVEDMNGACCAPACAALGSGARQRAGPAWTGARGYNAGRVGRARGNSHQRS
eukprot:15071616-Alexandrium_andersonii.AAC.1